MDIFEGRYGNLNRKFLMFIGQWPYDTKLKNLIRPCFMLALIILPVPQVISAVRYHDDVDRMMINALAFLTATVMFLKLAALTIAEGKMRELFENIANNWRAIVDEKERKILVKYSERARSITIFYATSMFMIGTLMTLPPTFHKVLDIIIPLEKSREPMYLMSGEFFVDRESHSILLFFWDYFTIMSVTVTTIAADTMYMACAEHCCAINAIISYRLQSLGQKSLDGQSNSNDDSYSKLIHIIHLHQRILSFTSSINDSYSLNFLFIMTVNLIIIPLNGCAIIATLDHIIRACPFIALFGAITLHYFVIFYPGQRILDHNLNIYNDAYCNQWYTTSFQTRKILSIFMLRCHQPASLSAGGLFLIDFKMFSKVMRTAVSYITVLASFR